MPKPKSPFRRLRSVTLALALAIAANIAANAVEKEGEIHLGSGAKAGEITDRSAIVLVRLTRTPGQDANGLIPGREGQARLHYGTDKAFAKAKSTGWKSVQPEADWSVQFRLSNLSPAQRHFYRVEYRADAKSPSRRSDVFSFVTAPRPGARAPVTFHLTTCQDLRGAETYVHMAAQQPDFCVSAGDTVYYDGQGNARNVAQAWGAYQKMFGLPPIKDYYRHVGGYFMKDDHDYRFNDSDPYMKGRWIAGKQAGSETRIIERRDKRVLDANWLSHEEGVRVFKQVFPMGDKTYRTVRWGRGVQLWMLEGRDFRSPNDMPDGPEKSIWGAEQTAWLKKTLLASDADFRVIISPTPIIGPDRLMKGDNHANLNGFWHEGQAFLDWLHEQKLTNVVLMCGDRHWQYHSVDKRNGRAISEFSCGPTCDEHVQPVPPEFEGVQQPYAASRGGWLTVSYEPSVGLRCAFFSPKGEPLYARTFPRP